MKTYTRVRYTGDLAINLGTHGELTPGSEVSLSYKEVQYLENSSDGWPDYLEIIEGSESDTKEGKHLVIEDDVEELGEKALRTVAKKEEIEIPRGMKELGALRSLIRRERLAYAHKAKMKEQEKAPAGNAIKAKALFSDPSSANAPEGTDPKTQIPPYKDWSWLDLQAEVKGRTLEYDGRLNKVKAVAALEANDEAVG